MLTTEGPLLLLAGAGSGKTTVLINRIANLIAFGEGSDSNEIPEYIAEADVTYLEDYLKTRDPAMQQQAERLCALRPAAPWSILAITFTNKAANELKDRLGKLLGEQAVANTLEKYFIVRIAWVFGQNGKNFIKTMLTVGKNHDKLTVVNDQIGTPTYTFDLARLLVDMAESEKYGYYHATNEGGYISWYDFTKEIYRQAGYKTEVLPVTTAEYGLSKAARPFNSRLNKSKLVEAGFTPLPTWQDALSRYLKEIEQ